LVEILTSPIDPFPECNNVFSANWAENVSSFYGLNGKHCFLKLAAYLLIDKF